MVSYFYPKNNHVSGLLIHKKQMSFSYCIKKDLVVTNAWHIILVSQDELGGNSCMNVTDGSVWSMTWSSLEEGEKSFPWQCCQTKFIFRDPCLNFQISSSKMVELIFQIFLSLYRQLSSSCKTKFKLYRQWGNMNSLCWAK